MIHLKQEIANIFTEINPKLTASWLNSFTTNVDAMNEQEQLAAISLFWNIKLGMLPVNTVLEREYLSVDVSGKIWLSRFKKHIVPVILLHGLL